MLPNFFVIGATKAGTTSLSQYLDAHPEIHMSPIKEPHFFAEREDAPATIADRMATLPEYERLFNSALPARGEASTSYSHYPARRGVPERIRARIPEARFLYLVRDPIDRLVSHYRHQVAFEGEGRSIESAVGDIRRPENIYVCAGRYATQLRRYLRLFQSDRVLVLDQRELRHRREETLREVFVFLGVDSGYVSPEFMRESNTASGNRTYPPRYVRLRRRMSARRLPDPVRTGLRAAVQQFERRIWPSVREVELPEPLRAQLVEVYGPEVDDLRALTGRPFDGWSL